MRNIWISLMLVCLPLMAFASVEFFALLPNPAGDDTLGEYIEIRNTGCASVDIGGYHLYDASQNSYTIPSGTSIGVHSNLTFSYSETKISLNNTGIETITLTSTTGSIIDTETYSGTQQDNVVIYLSPVDENCGSSTNTGDTMTGTTHTGTTNTGTASTGSIDIVSNSTGAVSTGSTASGTMSIDPTTSGSTNTGSILINTGTTNTSSGSSSSNSGSITFPNIIPTPQEPTNATLGPVPI